MRKITIYERYFKRPQDFIVALLALIILSPLFLVLALLVRSKLGRPVVFSQKRPGLNEEIFTIYKFRTMTTETDKDGNLLSDSVRLTKFGRFLRSTSMDELPELWNIVKGEMSFVGPRPLLPEYLPLYNETQRQRHSIRPGLTGLAQISGRNSISWESKFDLDLEYLEKITFMKDTIIFFSTIYKAARRKGVSSGTTETMEAFSGIREVNSQ